MTGTEGRYYPDSIIQEVRLNGYRSCHYVVQWVGYESEFNTLEAKADLEETAVLDLFEHKDFATTSRSSVGLLRSQLECFSNR